MSVVPDGLLQEHVGSVPFQGLIEALPDDRVHAVLAEGFGRS